MLNISIDDESEKYLVEILQQEKTTVSELIKRLLRNHLNISLNAQRPQQTVLERMGGMPEHLLSDGDLSDRDRRREIIAERIQANHQDRS
jgi:predicted CopG family antitoxin